MGKKDCKCLKNKKCSSIICKLCKIPNEPIQYLNLNKSFREMAVELDLLIDNITNDTLIKEFLNNPFSFDPILLNKYLRRIRNYCNIFVNDIENIPKGFSRRISFIDNEGSPLIDVSTFNLELGNLNYYNCAPLFFFNPPLHFNFIPSNPNLINIDTCHTLPIGIRNNTITLKCGSPTPPILNIEDETVGESNFLSYTVQEKQTLRPEVQQAILGKYGYSSRIATINYKLNFYIAKKVDVNLSLGYSVVFRISYFSN